MSGDFLSNYQLYIRKIIFYSIKIIKIYFKKQKTREKNFVLQGLFRIILK